MPATSANGTAIMTRRRIDESRHPRRRLPHAGRVRAARPDLDAVAAAPRQLASGRQAGAARLGRGGERDRPLRAGHGGREPRPVRERARHAAGARPRRRDLQQRRLDARLRPHLRGRRQGRRAPRPLGLQRLGRPLRRPLLPLGQGPDGAAQGGRDRARRPLQGAAGHWRAARSTSTARAP